MSYYYIEEYEAPYYGRGTGDGCSPKDYMKTIAAYEGYEYNEDSYD